MASAPFQQGAEKEIARSSTTAFRVSRSVCVRSSLRFLSIEPLIAPVGGMDLDGIHWVIAGGESGPAARPMHIEWARKVRDECARQGVAFFFKQWGGFRPKSGGRELDGREWNEMPEAVAA